MIGEQIIHIAGRAVFLNIFRRSEKAAADFLGGDSYRVGMGKRFIIDADVGFERTDIRHFIGYVVFKGKIRILANKFPDLTHADIVGNRVRHGQTDNAAVGIGLFGIVVHGTHRPDNVLSNVQHSLPFRGYNRTAAVAD